MNKPGVNSIKVNSSSAVVSIFLLIYHDLLVQKPPIGWSLCVLALAVEKVTIQFHVNEYT